MQTLVIRIPDRLAEELELEARMTRLTKSEVARRRLIAGGGGPVGFEMIADLVGSVEGGPSRKNHYLNTTGYGKKRDR
jgi:hypothetical protein